MRSFGQDPKSVADKTVAYLRGVQEARVLACAKHFPGHGQPSQDSHKELPKVTRSREDLEKIDLYPFKEAVRENIGAIMMGHLVVPSLDPSNKPATLSRAIVHDLLRKDWGYQGLIITDALNMKGLTNNYSVEDIAIEAFSAGNDILLYGDHIAPNVDRIITNDIPKAYAAIKEAVLSKKISEKELDEHVFRILQAKEKIGLLENRQNRIVSDIELMDRLHDGYAYRLKKDLYCEAMTVIKNEKSLLPFANQKKCYYLRMGDVDQDVFFDHLQKQLDIQTMTVEEITKDKKSYPVIVSIFSLNPKVKDYAMQSQWLEDIQKLNKTNQVIVVIFGTPYAARFFESPNSVIVAYEDDLDAQIAAARIITNKKRPKGILPVTASKKYPVGTSIVW
jgi:beta-glucosidase-like glycosyl hydrolase